MNDLIAAFNEYFEVISADTPELLHEVFKLRYQALCIERTFPNFDASNFPEQLEADEFDKQAVHCLLRHRSSDRFVGTLRLVLCNPLDPERPFPLEEYTQIRPGLLNVTRPYRRQSAEISRLVILNRFPHRQNDSRRKKDISSGGARTALKPRRRFPHPVLGLMVGLMRMCHEQNIIHWYAAMDAPLNRLLSLYGLQLYPVGLEIEHHGPRRPYFIKLSKVLNRMYVHHREVWELLTDYGKVWPAALEKRAQPRPVDASRILLRETA